MVKKGHLPKPSFRPHKVHPLVLDVISVDGVIDISLRKPTSSVVTKKGEVGGREIKINGRVGTRSEQFLTYLSSMMDCLGRNWCHGRLYINQLESGSLLRVEDTNVFICLFTLRF